MPTALADAARELLATLDDTAAGDAPIERRLRALEAAIAAATGEDAATALRMLAGALDRPTDTASAGVAASALGAIIEAGHDPAPARAPLLACLRRLMPGCVTLVETARTAVGEPSPGLDEDAIAEWLEEREVLALQRAAASMPEATDDWQRLGAIWHGAVALFSADAAARVAAQDLYVQTEALADLHEGASWLHTILGVPHEEPFVAIEPATRTGIAGRMSGIAENFQLNVLLMDAVPGGEERVAAAAVAVARGDGPQQIEEWVTGAWNLFAATALGDDGTLPDPSDHSRSDTWIWNEGVPADIPLVDGHRVILLGPAPYPRTWRAQRMFVSLPARLDADPLAAAAIDDWLARIVAANRQVSDQTRT